MKTIRAALLATLALAGCSRHEPPAAAPSGEATATTTQANAAFAQALSLADAWDFDEARRGLVAPATGKILAEDGSVITDLDAFKFV
ncbi:hypothetical protein Q6281_28875, partial [Klebsiella pneumoniae]|nr:hypothetical protein [Klebsiella pneumoniae]